MRSSWKFFLDKERIKHEIFSVNLIRILLALPEPQDYLSLIGSSKFKSLHDYVINSIREQYYTASTEDLTETSFNKHKSELFSKYEIEGDSKNKLDRLYLKLEKEYISYNNYYCSSEHAYHNAIREARNRIWIYQTWLPGHEKDGEEIGNKNISDVRLLLLSFKVDLDQNPPIYSPIYSRIRGRKLKTEEAQLFSARSVKALAEKCLDRNIDVSNVVRFNCGHHPGWIAIIDESVFCGFTPINLESHAKNFLFHQYLIDSEEGKFWKNQFELLWGTYSHSFEQEKQYNPKLSSD